MTTARDLSALAARWPSQVPGGINSPCPGTTRQQQAGRLRHSINGDQDAAPLPAGRSRFDRDSYELFQDRHEPGRRSRNLNSGDARRPDVPADCSPPPHGGAAFINFTSKPQVSGSRPARCPPLVEAGSANLFPSTSASAGIAVSRCPPCRLAATYPAPAVHRHPPRCTTPTPLLGFCRAGALCLK